MVEAGLIASLKLNGPLVALVAQRIYNRAVPGSNTVQPYIVWQRINTPMNYAHDGARHSDSRWQFAVWARDAETAQNVGDALTNAASLYIDSKLMRAFVENRFDRYEKATDLHSVVIEISSLTKE